MSKLHDRLMALEKKCAKFEAEHKGKCYHVSELMAAPYGKLSEATSAAMPIRRGCIELHFCRWGYPIELHRIRDPMDLLAWIRHLSGKNWMKKEYLEAFLERVCAVKGWKIPNP